MTVVDSPARRRRRAPDDLSEESILAALLATEYKRLLPELEPVTLTRGQIIYRADQEIEEVYFPESAVVATRASGSGLVRFLPQRGMNTEVGRTTA